MPKSTFAKTNEFSPKNVSNSNLLNSISNRERDIVRLLIAKKSSKDIADNLNISKHTV